MDVGQQLSYKRLLASLCLLVSLLLRRTNSDAVHWNYHVGGDGGPDLWYNKYTACGGVMQSPIDIQRDSVIFDPNLEPFDFSDYKITDGVEMALENKEGHTAELIFSGKTLYLSGGSLPDRYKLEQIHFHWGHHSMQGSEHAVDGQHYPMELHAVHSQRRLQNITNAAEYPFGLAVVSYLFKIGKKNDNYDTFLQHFQKIVNASQKIKIPTFPLYQLLPAFSEDKYYRYDGSLTTPPCYETVIWSLSTQFVEISEEQMDIFRGLYDEEYHPLVNDFRPVQSLNRRTVLTSDMWYNKSVVSKPLTWILLLLASLSLALV